MNNKNSRKNKDKKSKKTQFNQNFIFLMLIVLGGFYVYSIVSSVGGVAPEQLTYGNFYKALENNNTTPKIKSVTKIENELQGEFLDGRKFKVYIPSDDKDLIALLKNNVGDFNVEPQRTLLINIIFSFGPILFFILLLWYMSYRGSQMGNRIWSFGKIKKKQSGAQSGPPITFNDVAGVDEAKEELQEVIEFLKDPKRFQKLGGKIPKGVLLIGPPGTGKTLLAKAVSGEAGVPFFSISGSDFVEMFVGVGASRVRDLFEQGRRSASTSGKGAIIFIDEIDAVGRQRFAGIGGGHDEREQTLNQLLVEMDGFDTQYGLILVAATNRPDTLDPALLRPGRFDRTIVVDRPDLVGREAILKVHVRNVKLDPSVDLMSVAQQTPGFSGADLANICNEAALLAARFNKPAVGMPEFQAATERVIAGPERKSRVISKGEKKIVSYHESGHTLLSLLLPKVDPLHKVSIIPRGVAALGYTLQLPMQDRYLMTKSELTERVIVLLGGRIAEEVIFGEVSTGAENDFEVATKLARRMVCEFGMSDRLGHVTLGNKHGPIFLGRDLVEERNYSEDTAKVIDEEIKRIVDECYEQGKKLLLANKEKLEILAQNLLEKEVLDGDEVRKMLGLEAKEAKEDKTKDKKEAKQEKPVDKSKS